MDKPRIIKIIRDWQDCRGSFRVPTFVQVPGAWASAVASLITLSQEHRHNGLIVTSIGPGSLAATAGISRGDVLLRYGGVEVDSVATLRKLAKRRAQTGELVRTVVIDAARGAEDVSFTVEPGPLGITVSPSLHRLPPVLTSKPVLPSRKDAFSATTAPEEIARQDSSPPALVEVPGDLALKLFSLVKSLEASGKPKKRAKALLSALQA